MESEIFDIRLACDGIDYDGWVNPSDKVNNNGMPSSFHVVLNHISFGYLSLSNDTWKADKQRPQKLVTAIGEQIGKYYRQPAL